MKIRNVTNNEANPKIPKIIESSHRLVVFFFISFADINIEMSKIIEKMKFGVRINGVGGNCAGTPSFMTFSLVTIAHAANLMTLTKTVTPSNTIRSRE